MGYAASRTVMLRMLGALCVGLAGCGGGGGGGGSGDGARVNAPPVFGALAYATKQDTDLSGQIAATDPAGETLTFSVAANPGNGALSSFNPSGSFVYRPAAGFTGDDSFRVQVTDTGGNSVVGTVAINVHANRVPVAANDVVRADDAGLASIAVLANDTDADTDPLVVTLEEAPLAGTASVNADSTVRIEALPAGFKGITRFRYRITDSSGASSVASVAVFVGTDPLRLVFAGDPAANGSTEIFLSDFVSDPVALTSATEGGMRLRGFAVSENGATVVYRREDQAAPATMDLAFVRSNAGGQRTTIALPAGATLPLDAGDAEQFVVSPDGQWIALVARASGADGVYALDVASPATLTKVSPAGTVFASRLSFSRDSRNLYFLASGDAAGAHKTLYTVTPADPAVTTTVSALSDPATSDDVIDYSFSADQAAILVQASRNGRVGLFFIDARQLQTEVPVSHPLAFGESLAESTITLPGGTIGAALGGRVGYTVRTLALTYKAYVAEVSATPNPREIASGAQVIGLRPDDGALLYAKSGQIFEHDLVAAGPDTLIAAGNVAWYDSTGNIVLVKQFSGPTAYPVAAVTTRGSFGAAQPLGTPVLAAHLIEVSGFDRGIAVLGEGSPSGAAPARARLALVNALAPDRLLLPADFESPLQLTSPTARIVTN